MSNMTNEDIQSALKTILQKITKLEEEVKSLKEQVARLKNLPG